MFKPISRRTALKSVCGTIALPLLEAMQPFHALASEAAPKGSTPPKRIAFMYIPNGVITQHWFPKPDQQDWLESQTLKPLQSVKDDIVVINGLNRVYVAGEPHSQAASCWLTSSRPHDRPDGSTAINTTLDQVISKTIGNATPFPSLELSCNSFTDNQEPKLFDAISWYGPAHDARSENDPRKVFQRLFGESQHFDKSVLDTVLDEARSLKKKIGVNDQKKLDEYLESVRAIENRVHHQAKSKSRLGKIDFDMPEVIPDNRREYIRLMGDMMVLALRTDQTRIATFMVGPERWATPQLYEGIFDSPVQHHQMTHDDAYDEDVALIDRFHVDQFLYILNQLKNFKEGESCLLDSTYFVFGSGLGDGNSHSYQELPLIVAGGGAHGIQTGRQIQCEPGTPLANLWLTLANQMGINIDEFADSTRPLTAYSG